MIGIGYGVHEYVKPKGWKPKKNLFESTEKMIITNTWYSALEAWYIEIKVKPNTNYTLSSNVPPPTTETSLYFNGTDTISSGVWVNYSKTKISGADGILHIAIPIEREYAQSLINGVYYIQLEEGSIATPYEKYQLIAE